MVHVFNFLILVAILCMASNIFLYCFFNDKKDTAKRVAVYLLPFLMFFPSYHSEHNSRVVFTSTLLFAGSLSIAAIVLVFFL